MSYRHQQPQYGYTRNTYSDQFIDPYPQMQDEYYDDMYTSPSQSSYPTQIPRNMRHSDSVTIDPQDLHVGRGYDNTRYSSSGDARYESAGSSPTTDGDFQVSSSAQSKGRRKSKDAETYVQAGGLLIPHKSKPRYYCDVPGCIDETGRQRSASRKADLKRHQESVHKGPTISCEWPRCKRRGEEGFSRRDHYTEHILGYHGGQLPDGTTMSAHRRRGS